MRIAARIAGLSLAALLAFAAAAQDLTGRWQGNDGGTYWVRQLGDVLWWYGERGTDWTNVFHGRIGGGSVSGTWSDVPRGGANGAGELTLRLVSPDHFVAERRTGGFSGSEWRRAGSPAGTAPPQPAAPPGAWLVPGQYQWTRCAVVFCGRVEFTADGRFAHEGAPNHPAKSGSYQCTQQACLLRSNDGTTNQLRLDAAGRWCWAADASICLGPR